MNSKIACITGASSGIGKSTAIALAAKGFDLIICGRRKERLEELSKSLTGKVKVHLLVFDVRNKADVQNAFHALPDAFQKIDVLVNCAGNAHGRSAIHEGDLNDWDAMIDGNVQGLLYVSRMVMPGMVERKSGHIVNISSVAGKYTYENGAVYCASKSAVESISEGMRLDLTKHGIKVTNIAPGAVETEFSLVRYKGDAEQAAKTYAGFKPLKAEDIADAIVYAVSAPPHVTVADITLYASAQSSPTTVYKEIK